MRDDFFYEMKKMQERMDRLFEEFFRNGHVSNRKLLSGGAGTMIPAKDDVLDLPLTDFWETDKEFRAEIDLPGVDKSDIRLNVTKNALEVRAEKRKEQRQQKKGVYRAERSYKGYYRKIALPENADTEKPGAKFENGVLKITLPKKAMPEHKPRQIDVK